MIRDVDVLVVGAGSAGAATALAFAQAGRTVVMVDKRDHGTTGARWVNAVPRWCFEEARFDVPPNAVVFAHRGSRGFHLVAPNGSARVCMRDVPLLHIDMRALVADLVERALAAGATLLRGHVRSVDVAREGERTLQFEDGSTQFAIRARLVVDASGLGGAVRTRVAALSDHCPTPDPVDRCSAAQYQYSVRDPEGLAAFLAQYGAQPGDDIAFPAIAGGYSTLTLFTHPDLSEVGVLTGSIPALGVDDGGAILDRFVERAPFLGERLYGGRGAIPLGRPYATLGASGVALVGDAACQVYASHGSGVGMGLLAARTLADAASGAADLGSAAVLDAYSKRYRVAYGGLLAASDLFRRYVQGLGPSDIDNMVGSGLLDVSLASAALEQRPARPDLRFVVSAPARALRAPRVALRFLPVAARTVAVDRLSPLTAAPAIGRTIDRAIHWMMGDRAVRAPEAAWTMPDPSAGAVR